jgi:hypothetical protein
MVWLAEISYKIMIYMYCNYYLYLFVFDFLHNNIDESLD